MVTDQRAVLNELLRYYMTNCTTTKFNSYTKIRTIECQLEASYRAKSQCSLVDAEKPNYYGKVISTVLFAVQKLYHRNDTTAISWNMQEIPKVVDVYVSVCTQLDTQVHIRWQFSFPQYHAQAPETGN